MQDEIHLLHDDRGPVLEALVARYAVCALHTLWASKNMALYFVHIFANY